MRVGLVVEGVDLAVARRAVEAHRLGEGPVRLEPDDAGAAGRGATLELAEQAAADPQAARRLCDPHALELRRFVAVELQPAAADRLAPQGRHEEQSRRRPELVELGGDAHRGVAPPVETPARLREILAYTQPGVAGSP